MSGSGSIRIAATLPARLRGLLFRDPSWLGEGGVLMIVPCGSVHTFFMRYAIDVAFVDKKGKVVASERAVNPGRVLSACGAVAVIERFADSKSRWYGNGDTLVFAERSHRARHSVYLLG